jgi:hypothetical protein
MIVMLMVAGMTLAPNTALADGRGALDACKRLAAAGAVEPAGATVEQRALIQPRKRELDSLIIFTARTHEVMRTGQWSDGLHQQYLTVIRDLVNAGQAVAVLPEETLAWERIGLVLSYEQYRVVAGRVQAGTAPAQQLGMARAQFERFRDRYQAALARYAPQR